MTKLLAYLDSYNGSYTSAIVIHARSCYGI